MHIIQSSKTWMTCFCRNVCFWKNHWIELQG